jgi:hypothetical protein
MTTNRPSDAAVVAVKDTDKAIVLTAIVTRATYMPIRKKVPLLPLPKPHVTLPAQAASRLLLPTA